MWILRVKRTFKARHFLPLYKGKKEKSHPHKFSVEVEIECKELSKEGYGIDFFEIENYLKEILPEGKDLNDEFKFIASTENFAKWIYYKVKEKFPDVKRVILWENPRFCAIYREDENETC